MRGATRVLTKPDTVEDMEALLSAAITSACTGITLPARGGKASKRRTAFDDTPPPSGPASIG